VFKTVSIIVLALIAAVLAYAAFRPDSFEVRRAATIQAPPEKIFPLINDFHQWSAWSPWEKMDPAMKRTHTGAAAGKGAAYAWEGNSKVGQGRMEITESSPPSRIAIQLDFIKPFEGHNVAEFTLVPQNGATQVHWAMRGPSPYVARLMGIFFNMDKMIGQDFEAGLANLKAAAEK
jgi:uncharacterized protein YndB with AHSA1/START domain